ncbi:MAG: DUF4416 family protein [Phycisphaerae bacterium]
MAIPGPHLPVLRFCGLLAGSTDQLAAARHELSQWYGPIHHATEPIEFNFTEYYTPEMGPKLLRQWVRFSTLFAPDQLARCKLETNMSEILLARQLDSGVPRPVNIDPGYVTRSKVVLASTKDHGHRIYLEQGIYAEVTLHWTAAGWGFSSWTYADHKTPTAIKFFTQSRQYYFRQLQLTMAIPNTEKLESPATAEPDEMKGSRID